MDSKSYLNKFVPLGNLKLNHELVSIDARARELHFANGVVTKYDASGLLDTVARHDSHDQGRTDRCRRSRQPSGLLDLRSGECRRES